MEQEPRPKFKIREATPRDASEVRHMQAESWLATYPNPEIGISHEWVKQETDSWLTPGALEGSREYFEVMLADPTQFYRLAEKDGAIVGFIHLSTKEDGNKKLEGLYTLPETFGSGLGDQLMDLGDFWVDGVTTTLWVVEHNKRAVRFYERHGFVMQGERNLFKEMMPGVKMIREGNK